MQTDKILHFMLDNYWKTHFYTKAKNSSLDQQIFHLTVFFYFFYKNSLYTFFYGSNIKQRRKYMIITSTLRQKNTKIYTSI